MHACSLKNKEVDHGGKLFRVRESRLLNKRARKKNSPSLRKASHSKPRPYFSNCMQNDVTLFASLLEQFPQKKQLFTTQTLKDWDTRPNPKSAHLSHIITGGSTFQSWSFDMSITRWSHFHFYTRNAFASSTLKQQSFN